MNAPPELAGRHTGLPPQVNSEKLMVNRAAVSQLRACSLVTCHWSLVTLCSLKKTTDDLGATGGYWFTEEGKLILFGLAIGAISVLTLSVVVSLTHSAMSHTLTIHAIAHSFVSHSVRTMVLHSFTHFLHDAA